MKKFRSILPTSRRQRPSIESRLDQMEPRDPTSTDWYVARLQQYLSAHVARDRELGGVRPSRTPCNWITKGTARYEHEATSVIGGLRARDEHRRGDGSAVRQRRLRHREPNGANAPEGLH